MKKEAVFVLVLFVFLSFASAVCTDNSQIILQVYANNNTHGALWNQSYPMNICYNDLFGKAYTSANPHICTGTNTVLKLSGENNAHAESPALNNYSYSVCYGDLVCTLSSSCSAVEVVRLSSVSNAHLSKDGTYSNIICCMSASAGAIPTIAHWRNMKGETIDGLEMNVNDSVTLYAKTDPSLTVTFNIYSRTGGINSIRTGFTNQSNSNGDVYYTWKISDSDMSHVSGGKSEFYFNVSASGVNAMSPGLFVNNTAGNIIPSCAIQSPSLGSIYFTGNSVPLNALPNADDPDSVVSINWKIIDSKSGSIEGSATGESASQTLNSVGTKIIRLSVTDDSGASCYNETGISVTRFSATAENNVFAWVSAPLENQTFTINRVDYSAVGSYAYSLTGTSCSSLTFSCLGGNCPTQINCGANSYSMAPSGYANLYFGWIFDGTLDAGASGNAKKDGSRSYTSSGSKTIKVIVNYSSASDSKTRRFLVVSGCERPQINQAWAITILPDGTIDRKNPLTTPGVCTGNDTIAGNAGDCCPDGGWICSNVGGNPLCIQPTVSPAFCDDYTNEEDCKKDLYGVGTSDNYDSNSPDLYALLNCSTSTILSGNVYTVICGATSSDARNGCTWNNNSCWLNVSYQRYEAGEVVNVAGCLYRSALGPCTGGYQSVSIVGEPASNPITPGVSCDAIEGDYTILCGRTGVKLPFFDMTQFVIAIVLLIIIYALFKSGIFNKKRKGRKR